LYILSMQAGEVRLSKKMVLTNRQQNCTTPLLVEQMEAALDMPVVLNKSMANFYSLKITGNNIAVYEQKDLEITGDMTLDLVVTRTATDIDGNVYQTVKIGDQWWMTENLKAVHYRNNDPVTHVTDASQWINHGTGFYCNYDNEEEMGAIYGRLYNLFVLKDSRIIAPEGWHVPSDEDWLALIDFLGGAATAGGKMKEADTTHWARPNTGATNESGFTALPSGYRGCGGSFRELRYITYFWSSTFSDFELTSFRILRWDSTAVIAQSYGTLDGYSIRCIRD